MSHLLKTVNPQAVGEEGEAAPIVQESDPRPPLPAKVIDEVTQSESESTTLVPSDSALPGVGAGVAYFPRPGELRAGKGIHGAIVTAVNEDDGTLDLVVVYDADDFIGMRRVPRRVNDEGMGWQPQCMDAALAARVAALEAVVASFGLKLFGALELPDGDTILGVLDEHEDRIATIETATARPVIPVRHAQARSTKARAKARPSSGKSKSSGKKGAEEAAPTT